MEKNETPDERREPAGTESGDVLSVDEAAELLRVGRNALYEAIGRLEVPHRRVGKAIRLSRVALLRWLASGVQS